MILPALSLISLFTLTLLSRVDAIKPLSPRASVTPPSTCYVCHYLGASGYLYKSARDSTSLTCNYGYGSAICVYSLMDGKLSSSSGTSGTDCTNVPVAAAAKYLCPMTDGNASPLQYEADDNQGSLTCEYQDTFNCNYSTNSGALTGGPAAKCLTSVPCVPMKRRRNRARDDVVKVEERRETKILEIIKRANQDLLQKVPKVPLKFRKRNGAIVVPRVD